MRRTARRALVLGCAAALAVLFVGRAALADPPADAKLASELRTNLPRAVDVDGVRENTKQLPSRSVDELHELRKEAEDLTANVLAKQRRIEQTEAMLRGAADSNAAGRGALSALRLLAIERERKTRFDDALRRAAESAVKWNGGKPLDGAWPKGWLESQEGKQFDTEFQEIHASSRVALAEEKQRAQVGATPVEVTLGEIKREAATELAELTKFIVDVRRELVKRGESDPDLSTAEDSLERQREKERADDSARYRIRLTALRTQYESKTGEAVSVWFRVWNGKKPYRATLRAPKSEQRVAERTLAEPGDHAVAVSYGKAGTYTAKLEVADEDGESKSVDFTITVTGDPVPPVKPALDGGGGGGAKPTGGGEPKMGTTSPILLMPAVPISGTFRAMMWLANAQLPRWDWDMLRDGLKTHGVPLSVTIGSDGKIEGKARYVLPTAEMKPFSDPTVTSAYWKVSFDVAGTVDWKTGKTTLRVTNGHDESGREGTTPISGRWRSWNVADYSVTLEGFSVPGPTASKWLAMMKTVPDLMKLDFEGRGLPTLVDAGAGPAFRDQGFFGQAMGEPSEPTPRVMVYGRFANGSQFGDKPEQERDDAVRENGYRQMEANGKHGQWYLKILGPGIADPVVPPPSGPKRGDLLAFGLWPTTPITVKVGKTAKADAMGVFSDDVDDAVDLSAASTWTASGGLTPLGNGAFRATTPGTFSITATHPGSPGSLGPMSSTIEVRVVP